VEVGPALRLVVDPGIALTDASGRGYFVLPDGRERFTFALSFGVETFYAGMIRDSSSGA